MSRDKKSFSRSDSTIETTNIDNRIAAEGSNIAASGSTLNVTTADPEVLIEALNKNTEVATGALESGLLGNLAALTTIEDLSEKAFEFSSRAGDTQAALTKSAIGKLEKNLSGQAEKQGANTFKLVSVGAAALVAVVIAFVMLRKK